MTRIRFLVPGAVALLLSTAGCADDPTTPAPMPAEGEVFLDEYGTGVTFQAFAGSKYDAVQVDQVERHAGTASLKVTVPAEGDPSGTYAGGAFTVDIPRDLAEYDALTFWARASTPASLDVVGLGNDNTETTPYVAERRGVALTTTWTRYVIPIPDPARLTAEDGLFFFAEGPEAGAANTIWFDEVQFETLGTLANARPAMAPQDVSVEVGSTVQVTGTEVTVDVAGVDVTVAAAPAYFAFQSSDEAVATVSAAGLITVVGEGSASITAALGGTAASGEVAVATVLPPAEAAPTPTAAAADVISLFSDAYTNVTVDTWSAEWDDAAVADVQVEGDNVKKYSNLVFAGIEFGSAPVDASAMTHFHMDLWTPDATADPAAFKVKLVDFGADGAYGGGDDVEHEMTFTAATTPALATGSWVSIDVPLADFAGLTTRGALAQMILSGDPNTVYVDNVYFYAGEVVAPTEPAEAAPTPTTAEADVVSLFSNAYTDVTVSTWSAEWDNATVADVQVAGDAVKLYTGLAYAGIEMPPVDASGMTHFHMDIWTPDATADPAAFKIKLVDFGADGAYGGGDDVEHEMTFTAATTPALATGSWVSIDVPLADFTGLTTQGAIAQLIIVGEGTVNTVYVDNIYFRK